MGIDARHALLACALAACFFHGTARSAGDRSPEDPVPPAAEREDVRGLELAELETVGTALKAHPDSFPLRLRRLRVLHVLAVKDAERIRTGEEEIGRLGAGNGNPQKGPLLQAYRGAFQVLRAKHASWPPRKREHLKAGLTALDSAVAARPRDVEIRYLRLMSCYHLPFFIGRKAGVRGDFSALGRLLPEARGDYPGRWYLGLARFVLAKGELDPADREALSEAVQAAVEEGAARPQEGAGL